MVRKLGRCFMCKKPVSCMFERDFLGRKGKPKFVIQESKDRVFHNHCWEDYQKAVAKRRKLGLKGFSYEKEPY